MNAPALIGTGHRATYEVAMYPPLLRDEDCGCFGDQSCRACRRGSSCKWTTADLLPSTGRIGGRMATFYADRDARGGFPDNDAQEAAA